VASLSSTGGSVASRESAPKRSNVSAGSGRLRTPFFQWSNAAPERNDDTEPPPRRKGCHVDHPRGACYGRVSWNKRSIPRWFDPARLNILIGVLLFTAFLVFNLFRARANAQIYFRPIAGLEALDEAIGRAPRWDAPSSTCRD